MNISIEEKILDVLAQLQQGQTTILSEMSNLTHRVANIETDVAELKTDFAEMKTDFAELKKDVAKLKTDVAELKTDVDMLKTYVARIEVTQENKVLPQIQLLSEGHEIIIKRLERLEPMRRSVGEIQVKVATLEYALKNNIPE